MTQQRRKLPIGVQTFSEIIRDDYYDVDITAIWVSESKLIRSARMFV